MNEIKNGIDFIPIKDYKEDKTINPYNLDETIPRNQYEVHKPRPTIDEIIERLIVQKIFADISKIFELHGADMTLPKNKEFLKRQISCTYRKLLAEGFDRLDEKNA